MTLQAIKCTDFRCLQSVCFEPEPGFNLVFGANASGKTSLLEAIAYLGRGRSFRGASTQDLIRRGCDEFILFGQADSGTRVSSLGVRNSRSGLEIHVDGEKASGAANLAEQLPLQVIDPDVHDLVAGGPELRRRYLDWVAFHVEQGYLDTWRRFRRALKQRNAALRSADGSLSGWDSELAGMGEAVHETRLRVLENCMPALADFGDALLGNGVTLEYRQGWPADKGLEEALRTHSERELQTGITQAGPHRADLTLRFDESKARKRVSRGQQKLLACAMVLAAAETVQSHLERPLLLLLDDPAAELDGESLERLMGSVSGLGCQVIATALEPDRVRFPQPPRLFHVEQGSVTAAS